MCIRRLWTIPWQNASYTETREADATSYKMRVFLVAHTLTINSFARKDKTQTYPYKDCRLCSDKKCLMQI